MLIFYEALLELNKCKNNVIWAKEKTKTIYVEKKKWGDDIINSFICIFMSTVQVKNYKNSNVI